MGKGKEEGNEVTEDGGIWVYVRGIFTAKQGEWVARGWFVDVNQKGFPWSGLPSRACMTCGMIRGTWV